MNTNLTMNNSLICDNLKENQIKKLFYLSKTNIQNTKNYFLNQIEFVINFYTSFLTNFNKEINNNIYFYSINNNINIPHPLSFECGHVIYFYSYHFLGNIKKYKLFQINNNLDNNEKNIFNSLINEPHERENNFSFSIEEQINYMNKIFNKIKKIIKNHTNNILSYIDSYILELCYLHFEMHKEVIFFICNQHKIYHYINIFKNKQIDYNNISNKKIENKWIYIDCKTETNNIIKYGINKENIISYNNKNKIIWDNECPNIEEKINNFYVQQYPVSYGEYIEFIEKRGYNNKKYWSFKGWNWLKKREIKNPINIFYNEKEKKWYRNHFNKVIELDYDLPVVHISYYEAEAYANFKEARIPTEIEYNYLLTNGGKTLFPWGNDTNTQKYCNSNFQNDDIIKVNHNDFKNGKNKWNIYSLLGNCWYWTSTNFYPYDKFEIDPIYETFSYPFFYFRNIVKGSSWCVNDNLFHSYYRNAQEKEKCFHFTGIFLVKN